MCSISMPSNSGSSNYKTWFTTPHILPTMPCPIEIHTVAPPRKELPIYVVVNGCVESFAPVEVCAFSSRQSFTWRHIVCYSVLLAGDTDVLLVMLRAAKRPLMCMGVWRFAG